MLPRWNIWYARNKLIWNKEDPKFEQLVHKSVAYWSHYANLRRETRTHHRARIAAEEWTNPPQGWMKINVGTRLVHTEGRTEMVFVLRNDNVQLQTTHTSSRRGLLQPILRNLHSIKEAVDWAEQMRMERIIIEVDNQAAVSMTNQCSRKDKAGVLAREMTTRLSQLPEFQIEATSKLCNSWALGVDSLNTE